MTIYEYGGKILIVDVGVMFPNEAMLGVDLVLPDWQYLKEKKEQVVGIVLTHGHEDHIGALPYFLKDGFLNVPIYATRLTRGLIENKLEEHGLLKEATISTYQAGDRVRVGPFEVEPIRVSHSIPDAVALAIRTPVGIVVQTGDFKFDHTPIDGRTTDLGHLARLGNEGVLMVLGDSTGVEKKGVTESEVVVAAALERVFASAEGRIIVASFASQLQRVHQVLHIARRHNRVIAAVGRSMTNNVRIAQELGYLDIPPGLLVSVEEALQKAHHEVAFLATGSQGEPRAALARMANGTHRQVSVEPGDTVVVSAGAIPGNEESVSRVIDNLFRLGATVIYDAIEKVHVSGHGSQQDIILMQRLLNPKYIVPLHGEYRHLVLHARLAASLGLPPSNIFIVENGQTLLLDEEYANVGERVPGGWVFVDGSRVGTIGSVVLRDREALSRDGFIVATVILDSETGGPIGRPKIVTRGFVFLRDSDEFIRRAEDAVLQTLQQNGVERGDANAIESRIRNTLSRLCYDETRRRPMILSVVTIV
ncbi:MAG: ribonuclease J [Ardenticatenales bacterium]|nr:ribonuclease J [Ardenticatenales bacterium]